MVAHYLSVLLLIEYHRVGLIVCILIMRMGIGVSLAKHA